MGKLALSELLDSQFLRMYMKKTCPQQYTNKRQAVGRVEFSPSTFVKTCFGLYPRRIETHLYLLLRDSALGERRRVRAHLSVGSSKSLCKIEQAGVFGRDGRLLLFWWWARLVVGRILSANGETMQQPVLFYRLSERHQSYR